VTITIGYPVQVLPLASDLDVGLIHTPACAHRAFALSEHRGQYRQDIHRPAMERGAVDTDTAFLHHFPNVPQAKG
jgi:hypothetical protein